MDDGSGAVDASDVSEAERFRRVEDLFLRASELPANRQSTFLERECADDAELLAEVRELLGFDAGAEERLGAAVGAGLEWVAEEPPMPDRLGPYRVLEEIGRGGLGTVYLAERDDAHFHMRVAIKVVRPEVRNPELERRLRRERQILAGLDHPHIARILDGGTAADGAPFLVMERVDGEPLTTYCERNALPLRRRLELFRKVCDAVHYAHRNLVLHRDLKPSNILVTEGDIPKLLDFGIAKVLHEGDSPTVNESVGTLTRPGTRPLTPEYASPEQVLDQPLTTGSDVYSLGVLLFELIAGMRPYEIETPRPTEIERVVCTVEPERPSTVARRRGDRPAWGDDLDNIVAMALRKEPERRYASVEQLSEDLRRYLYDLPVIARRDTFGYRAMKFVRRNRVSVIAAGFVLVTLLAAVGVTSHQARVADRERDRAQANLEVAEEQRQRAEEVADFLVDLFEISDPSHSRGATVTAREVLDQGARRIGWQLRERPALRTTLMTTIGRVYRQLGLLEASEEMLGDALEVRREDLDPDDPDLVVGLRELGLLRWEQGEYDASETLLREAMDREKGHRGETPIYAEILQDLALVLPDRGETAGARELLEKALEIRREAFGDRSAEVAETRDRLAQLLYEEGEYEEAERLARRALEDRRRALRELHPDVAQSLNNLAAVLQAQGDSAAAAELLEEAVSLRRRLYGEEHGAVAQALHNLATASLTLGDADRAATLFEEALEISRHYYGDDHPEVAQALHNLARLHLTQGRPEQARELHAQALEIRRRRLGEGHPATVQSLLGLADAQVRDDPEAAEALFREALALQRRHLAEDDHRRAYPIVRLGSFLCKKDPEEAVALLDEAWRLRRRLLPDGHWETAMAEALLGLCLEPIDSPGAEEHLRSALERLEAALGAEDGRTRRVRSWFERIAAGE